MSPITLEDLTPNAPTPKQSRAFSPEVVKQVHDYLTRDGDQRVENVGIGTFDKEGGARSALSTLNDLIVAANPGFVRRAATVRQTEDGKFRAILLNKPARKKGERTDGKPPRGKKS